MRVEINLLFIMKQITKPRLCPFFCKPLRKRLEHSRRRSNTTSLFSPLHFFPVLTASYVLYNRTEHTREFSICNVMSQYWTWLPEVDVALSSGTASIKFFQQFRWADDSLGEVIFLFFVLRSRQDEWTSSSTSPSFRVHFAFYFLICLRITLYQS